MVHSSVVHLGVLTFSLGTSDRELLPSCSPELWWLPDGEAKDVANQPGKGSILVSVNVRFIGCDHALRSLMPHRKSPILEGRVPPFGDRGIRLFKPPVPRRLPASKETLAQIHALCGFHLSGMYARHLSGSTRRPIPAIYTAEEVCGMCIRTRGCLPGQCS